MCGEVEGRDFTSREGLAEVICWASSFCFVSGRKKRPKTQPNPKSQARRIRKEPPAYAAGTLSVRSFVVSGSLTLFFVVFGGGGGGKGMMYQSVSLRRQLLNQGPGFGGQSDPCSRFGSSLIF